MRVRGKTRTIGAALSFQYHQVEAGGAINQDSQTMSINYAGFLSEPKKVREDCQERRRVASQNFLEKRDGNQATNPRGEPLVLFHPTSEVEDGGKHHKEYSHIEWEILLGHDQRLDKSKAIAVHASPATSSRSLHSSLPCEISQKYFFSSLSQYFLNPTHSHTFE